MYRRSGLAPFLHAASLTVTPGVLEQLEIGQLIVC